MASRHLHPAVNRRQHSSGHLFQGRYKARVIDSDTPGYLRAACDYVHLNPARAGLVETGEPLEKWRWSTYSENLGKPEGRSVWLRTDRLLGEHGIGRDDPRGRLELAARMRAQRGIEDTDMLTKLRSGWRFGAADFLDRLLVQRRVRAELGHGRVAHEET